MFPEKIAEVMSVDIIVHHCVNTDLRVKINFSNDELFPTMEIVFIKHQTYRCTNEEYIDEESFSNQILNNKLLFASIHYTHYTFPLKNYAHNWCLLCSLTRLT